MTVSSPTPLGFLLGASLVLTIAGCREVPAESNTRSAAAEPPTLRTTSVTVPREPDFEIARPKKPARVLSLPSIGILSWRCDDLRRPPRFAVALAIPSNAATVTGTVSLRGSRPAKFAVDANEAVATDLESATEQTWTLLSRHQPATLKVQLTLRFEPAPAERGCVIRNLTAKQTTTTEGVTGTP